MSTVAQGITTEKIDHTKKKVVSVCGERVLVRLLEADEKSPGGIVLPDAAAEPRRDMGTIVKMGKNALEFNEGDTIVFEKYGGTEVEINEEKLLVVKVEDILLKVNGS